MLGKVGRETAEPVTAQRMRSADSGAVSPYPSRHSDVRACPMFVSAKSDQFQDARRSCTPRSRDGIRFRLLLWAWIARSSGRGVFRSSRRPTPILRGHTGRGKID